MPPVVFVATPWAVENQRCALADPQRSIRGGLVDPPNPQPSNPSLGSRQTSGPCPRSRAIAAFAAETPAVTVGGMRLLLPSKIPLLRVSYPLVVYFVQSFLPQYQIAERKLEFALLLANLTELGVRQEDRDRACPNSRD